MNNLSTYFAQYIQTVAGSKKSKCLGKVKNILLSRVDGPVQATIILRNIHIQIKYPEFADIKFIVISARAKGRVE